MNPALKIAGPFALCRIENAQIFLLKTGVFRPVLISYVLLCTM